MKTSKAILLSLIMGILFTYTIEAQTYKVIVNPANNTTSLSKKDISDLFLKKKTKWTDGVTVLPVDQSANSKVRATFSQEILQKSVTAIRSFWQQAAFSGIASAPPEKANDQEVIEFVKKNPGAIGYVSDTASTNEVKVLTVN